MELAVFYHIWAATDLRYSLLLIDTQIMQLYRSGLASHAKIFCTVNGHNQSKVREYLTAYSDVIVLPSYDDTEPFECSTLTRLFEYCHSSPSSKVLYFHTKGITHMMTNHMDTLEDKLCKSANNWRGVMEWACVDHWRECVYHLHNHDVAGTRWVNAPPVDSHYSGNIWWANASHIITRPRPRDFEHHTIKWGPRFPYEYWAFGDGCKAYNMFPDMPDFTWNRSDIMPYMKHQSIKKGPPLGSLDIFNSNQHQRT